MGLPQGMRDTFVGWAMGLLHAQDRKIAQQCMNETVGPAVLSVPRRYP